MSATLTVDPKKYSRLANRVVVKAIETEEEYDRMVAAVEQLIDKGEDHLSPEESALLETLAILVQAYDDRYHPLPPVAPNEMLTSLMGTSGRTAKDLLPGLGTRGRVSEVLNGKRSISKEQEKKQATVYRATAVLPLKLGGAPGIGVCGSKIPLNARSAAVEGRREYFTTQS